MYYREYNEDLVVLVLTNLVLGLLAAVTDQNRIAIWKFVLGQAGKKVEAEDHWMLQPAVDLNLPCASIKV